MNDDQIRWSVTDPLGNEIILYESTFIRHIMGDHKSKDAQARMNIEEQIKVVLTSPRFIIKDQKFSNRWKYLDLVTLTVDEHNIKPVGIIVEVEKNPFKIVTWYARRVMDEPYMEGGLIYHAGFSRASRV